MLLLDLLFLRHIMCAVLHLNNFCLPCWRICVCLRRFIYSLFGSLVPGTVSRSGEERLIFLPPAWIQDRCSFSGLIETCFLGGSHPGSLVSCLRSACTPPCSVCSGSSALSTFRCCSCLEFCEKRCVLQSSATCSARGTLAGPFVTEVMSLGFLLSSFWGGLLWQTHCS